MDYLDIREQMCDIGKRVWQQGWAASNDGNFTVKISGDAFLTTPTGTSKGFMSPEMLILVDSNCHPLEDSKWKPSTELPMHIRCYRERPDIGAAVHAHPPIATAFAVAHIPLDSYTMPEAILALGSVPIAPYGCPSTDEVPESIVPFLQEHDAILLENHGAITVGKDLLTAYYRMETLEYYAKLTMNTRLLGQSYELPEDRLQELMELRKRFNFSGRHPGIKKYH